MIRIKENITINFCDFYIKRQPSKTNDSIKTRRSKIRVGTNPKNQIEDEEDDDERRYRRGEEEERAAVGDCFEWPVIKLRVLSSSLKAVAFFFFYGVSQFFWFFFFIFK